MDLNKILQSIKEILEKIKKAIQQISNQPPVQPPPSPSEPQPQNDYESFRAALRQSESSGNYQVVNSLGYMGAYQFGMARLCDFGLTKRKPGTTGWTNDCFEWIPPHTREEFLNSPAMQDDIFKKHVIGLMKYIKQNFSQYFNQTVGGIVVTLSGLVAGAHIGGYGGLKKFLEAGQNPTDAYGGSVAGYIRKFAGYNLDGLA